MPKRRASVAVLGLALGCLAHYGAPAFAADPPKPNVIEHWLVWPKDGHAGPLEAAMKSYVAWRKTAGDPRTWYAYEPVVGGDLGHLVFRAGPHFWRDFDAAAEWGRKSGLGARWEKVSPHVARLERYFYVLDAEHSLWPDGLEFEYVGALKLRLAPGAYDGMTDALARVRRIAVEKKWSRPFSVQWIVGGGDDMMIVNPFKSYADMADPETPFLKLVTEAVGSEQAAKDLMRQLWGSFEAGSYTIYAVRRDLSTPK